MVVGKLCMEDLVSPGTRVGPTEDPKVRLNFLVNTFRLAIGLWVIGGGERKVVVEEFAEFSGEGRGELWTTIRDDFVVKSEA